MIVGDQDRPFARAGHFGRHEGDRQQRGPRRDRDGPEAGAQAELTVNGRMYLENGVIQRGGTALTSTSDLGLYSQLDGQYIRVVTNKAPVRFYTTRAPGPRCG